MPSIFSTETITWFPISTLSEAEGLRFILLTCKLKTKGDSELYVVVPAVPHLGRAKLLEGGLSGKFADEVYEEVCSWARMPVGYALFTDKKRGGQKLKEKPSLFRRREPMKFTISRERSLNSFGQVPPTKVGGL